MSDLIDTTEMYLRTIFELEEEGITPLRARIAELLGHERDLGGEPEVDHEGPTVAAVVDHVAVEHPPRDHRHPDVGQVADDGRAHVVEEMRISGHYPGQVGGVPGERGELRARVTGLARRKENFAASSWSRPRSGPADMVTPEREMPARRARVRNMPMTADSRRHEWP